MSVNISKLQNIQICKQYHYFNIIRCPGKYNITNLVAMNN